MQKQRFVVLPVLNFLIICAQGATFWLWHKGAIAGFKQYYTAFGTGMPTWTTFVFSTWELWWLAPAIFAVILLIVLLRMRQSFHAAWLSFLASAAVLVAMWYAMYPIHAMGRVV